MRGWPFSKPKTPGFGISRGYYLTILSSKSVLPSIAEIANPGGAGGAAIGLAVPLEGSGDKAALLEPMQRGAYVVASKDRKTVLKMIVLSKEEAGYDPEDFVNSPLAMGRDPELVVRIRATWTIAQLVFESHDPGVYPALDFFLGVAVRMATLSDGVVADSISQRYLLPENVFTTSRLDPLVDVRDHLDVKFELRPDGLHAYTLGMQKFALPEYEILNLLDEDQSDAASFLIALCQSVLLGDLTKPGDKYGSPSALFEARDGGFDARLWQGIPVYELLPPGRTFSSIVIILPASLAASQIVSASRGLMKRALMTVDWIPSFDSSPAASQATLTIEPIAHIAIESDPAPAWERISAVPREIGVRDSGKRSSPAPRG